VSDAAQRFGLEVVRTSAERLRVGSASPWEATVGYARAVRVGNLVHVAGTTAVDADGRVVGGGDAAAQARFVLAKIAAALAAAGAHLEHVVRTRIYVTDIGAWPAIGAVHGEVFGAIRPAATMVEVRALIAPELLVEIEAEAIVG
jgi:enamine deaminase RidA (YjgF/YER057c/UK114 family)